MPPPQIERYFGDNCLIPALQAIGQSRQVYAREELPPHYEVNFEIHLIQDGSVHWWVEDEVYHLQPDSVYITKPGEMHGGVKNMIQPSTLTWLQVDPQHLTDEVLKNELYNLNKRFWLGASELVGYVTAMLDECRNPRPDSGRLVHAYLQLFLAQLLRQHRTRSEQKIYPPQFDDLLTYIETHLAEAITIDDLCHYSHLSRSRIFQLFDEYVGQSPVSHIMSLRIKRAQALLHQTDQSITDIAYELGFSSSQHFATAFKRHTGISPSAYRKT
ncbi:MAG: helix-turn-helix transcriptional regulator [Anaerolineales bacterium]|nr:helix-turn-helix transcriptional regulator [Anaerolineales bacterium]